MFSTEVGREKIYLKNETAKAAFLAEHPNHKKEFGRLEGPGRDGLGASCANTTMDPGRRTLLQVEVEQAALADEIVSTLMGDEVELRKQFIQQNANDVRFLDI